MIAVPVMALVLALGPRLLPEFRDPAASRLDVISAALSMLAVLCVVYGLKQIAQEGIGARSMLAVVGGIGIKTRPPSDSATKMRSASTSLPTPSDR